MMRLVRVSDPSLPFRPSTFYKWVHLGKNLDLFLRVGRRLFIDLEALERFLEGKRLGRGGVARGDG